MTTIRDIITLAYNDLGIAGLSPEEEATGKTMLAALIGKWAAEGARVSYSNGGLQDDANVPDWAVAALYAGLARMLAPGFGKTVSPETTELATSGKMAVLSRTCQPVPMKMYGYAGSGSPRLNLPIESESLWIGDDSALEF